MIDLIKDRALTYGDFTLSSGKKSNFYLDCRKLTLSWEGAREVAEAIKQILFKHFPKVTAIGGPSIGADPIIGSILMISHTKGFIIRKESKDHGTKSLIEGPLEKNDKVVIIEDVCTTGHSAMRAINIVNDYGATVLGVICVVDRLDGARKIFEANRIPFYSLTTIEALGLTKQSKREK